MVLLVETDSFVKRNEKKSNESTNIDDDGMYYAQLFFNSHE
jgi:hypothetical protein